MLIVALGMLAPAAPARAEDNPGYSYARIVRLSYVQGDVQIVRADKSNKWEQAALNMPVEQGFAIGTNDGQAEVEFEHGSMLWLAPNSVVQFTELALSNGGRITRMTLSQGVATFDASLSAGDIFEVTTPSFTVIPATNAEFKVGAREKNSAVSVLNGKVSIGGVPEAREVAKGEMFIDEPGKKPQISLLRSPAADEWDHWVRSRLTVERSGQSQAALNADAPFTYGMADLANYGSWNYFPGVGYGWQPWGMSAGWAPFTDGQWSFYPSLGWTWLSAEPWGWVPYHFGGWEYSPSFGWMWVPGDYGTWTAAPVQWFGVGKHIGWAPRAVNAPHPGSVATPVIVSTKTLGKEGRNQVLSSSEISARMQSLKIQSLAVAPERNGKPWAGGEPVSNARIAVPTAGNLRALSAGLAANGGAKVNVNALHEAATSRAAIAGPPAHAFAAVNAATVAPRVPGRPPMRVTFESPRMGGPGYAGRSGDTLPMPGASSPSFGMPSAGRAPMPAATSRPAPAGPGRPR
jgi:hypothetical protein